MAGGSRTAREMRRERRGWLRNNARIQQTAARACGFRAKPITDSGASRSLIPIQADHRFRTNPITDSGAKPITFRR